MCIVWYATLYYVPRMCTLMYSLHRHAMPLPLQCIVWQCTTYITGPANITGPLKRTLGEREFFETPRVGTTFWIRVKLEKFMSYLGLYIPPPSSFSIISNAIHCVIRILIIYSTLNYN